jgi:hypothetical protein
MKPVTKLVLTLLTTIAKTTTISLHEADAAVKSSLWLKKWDLLA